MFLFSNKLDLNQETRFTIQERRKKLTAKILFQSGASTKKRITAVIY
jgi:hypothetical protein